jgi:hypothetical protein
MTSLIRSRDPEEHRRIVKGAMDARVDEALRVRYGADVGHLVPLTSYDLGEWIEAKPKRGSLSLNTLYDITKGRL